MAGYLVAEQLLKSMRARRGLVSRAVVLTSLVEVNRGRMATYFRCAAER
jgi:hypothetical protein